jgi:hypothetical protein
MGDIETFDNRLRQEKQAARHPSRTKRGRDDSSSRYICPTKADREKAVQ